MKNKFWNILLVLVSFTLLGILLINDFNHALEFDSSFNLNVIKNIVFHGIYGTSVYLVDGQKYYWFDPWITTGPTVFLPAALFIKVISNFILVPRFVMNVFFVSFIYVLAKLIQVNQKKLQLKLIIIYVVSLVIIFSKFISNVTMLGVDFVGEVPAYLFILLSIWGLLLENPVIAGLSIGLAVLTKLQLIYFCIPLSLGYVFFFYKKSSKSVLKFILFAALPLLMYAGSLLVVYGRHIKSYYGDFKGVAIMQKAYPVMMDNINSLGSRFIHLLQYDPYFLLLSVLGIVIILFCWKKYTVKQKIVYTSFALYMGYYLFIWQFIAPRHFVIPKLFLFLLLGNIILEHLPTAYAKKIIFCLALFSFILFPLSLESNKALINQKTAANHIKNKYSDSTIYNIGWWKSPELQILLNKDFIRLDKKNREFCKRDCKLIIAQSVIKQDPTITPILMKYKKIDSFNGYDFYDLENVALKP